MMIGKQKKLLICIMTVILIVFIISIVLLFIQHKKKEQAYIQECYQKQNNAFLITKDYIYGLSDNNADISNIFDKIDLLPHLYAWLKFYEYETGITITLNDIKDYLSTQYEKDGSLRIYENYPSIKSYVNYMYEDFQQKRLKTTKLDEFDYKMLDIIQEIRKENPEYNYSNLPLPFVDEMIKKVYDPGYEIDYSLLTPKE